MDFQNKEFYELNKNTPDLIFPHATERITYRKVTTPEGKVQIIEIRKEYGSKKQTERVVHPHEMTVEQFDFWKKEATDFAHDYLNKDKRETRDNVSIENLLETDLVSSESVDDEYIRKEEEKHQSEREKIGKEVFSKLTPTQQQRYYKSMVDGKSTYDIAHEEDVSNVSVFESLESAEKRIDKELTKRGIKRKKS